MATEIKFKRTSDGSDFIANGGTIKKGEPFYDTTNKRLYVGDRDGDVVRDKRHIAEVSILTEASHGGTTVRIQVGDDTENAVEMQIPSQSDAYIFNYFIDESKNTAVIEGYNSLPQTGSVTIPEKVLLPTSSGECKLFDVVAIGDDALRGFESYELVIPRSISYIGNSALAECKICKLTLPFVGQKQWKESDDITYQNYAGSIFKGFSHTVVDELDVCHASVTDANNAGVTIYYQYQLPDGLNSIEILGGGIPTGSLACLYNKQIDVTIHDTTFMESAFNLPFTQPTGVSDPRVVFKNVLIGDVSYMNPNTSSPRLIIENIPRGITPIGGVLIMNLYTNNRTCFAFPDCGMSNLYVGKDTITVAPNAFVSNPNLSSVFWDAPSPSVTTPFLGTFGSTSKGASLTVGENAATIPDTTFAINVNAPAGFTSISFAGENLTSIGQKAFRGNCYLKEVVLPESVKTVGSYAFSLCSQLGTLYIPVSASVGTGAISGCFRLHNLTIPTLSNQLTSYRRHEDEETTYMEVSPMSLTRDVTFAYSDNTTVARKEFVVSIDTTTMTVSWYDYTTELLEGNVADEWFCVADAHLEAFASHPMFEMCIYKDEGIGYHIVFASASHCAYTYLGSDDFPEGKIALYPSPITMCNNRVKGGFQYWNNPLPYLYQFKGDLGHFLRFAYPEPEDGWDSDFNPTGWSYMIPCLTDVEIVEARNNPRKLGYAMADWVGNPRGYVWYGPCFTNATSFAVLTLPDLEDWRIEFVPDLSELTDSDFNADELPTIPIFTLWVAGGRYWNHTGRCLNRLEACPPDDGLYFQNPPPIKLIENERDRDTEYGMLSYLVSE